MTAAVITAHAAITYGAAGSWFFHDPDLTAAQAAVLNVPIALGALFAMGVFFFIAGYFVPDSLDRHGTGGFLRTRCARLGVPFLVFMLVVIPVVTWAVANATGLRLSLGAVGRRQLDGLDAGPLWFVGVLLLFSVVYAVARSLRGAASAGPSPRALPERRAPSPRMLLAWAGAIAGVTFVIRLRFPIDTFQLFSAHVWQWGQCAGLFALGISARRREWLGRVPARILRITGAGAALSVAVVIGVAATAGSTIDFYGGGLRWQAAVTAALEGVISIGAAVLLIELFRRHPGGRTVRALGRRAYGAYIAQTPVLVGLALALHHLALPGVDKLLILVATGLALSFAVAEGLLRVPALSRVL